LTNAINQTKTAKIEEMSGNSNGGNSGQSLGHPKGLYVLFFTEMWERFSYYGMRALLVLYMVNYFKWTQEQASEVYKWYTSLVYLTPILGGYLADRYLGNKKAVIIGAVMMAIGHFLMAFDAYTAFYAALAFLICGNGMFKPNMSTQVGRLYAPGDERKDAAYTIFYMGINLGAAFSPLVCGTLKASYGFHYGFAAAGVGMVIGLLTYLLGQRWVVEIDKGVVEAKKSDDDERESEPSVAPFMNKISPWFVFAAAFSFLPLAVAMYFMGAVDLSVQGIFPYLLCSAAFAMAGWILIKVKAAARDRVIAIYLLSLFVIFFWAAFEQAGNTMNLWADQTTDRYLTQKAPAPELYPAPPGEAVGFEKAAETGEGLFESIASWWRTASLAKWWSSLWNPVSAEWFQSVNPVAIFVLAPIFAWLWTFLARKKRNPSTATKMALGITLMAAAFAVMIIAAKIEDKESRVPLASYPNAVKLADGGKITYLDAPDFNGEVTNGAPDKNAKYNKAMAGRMSFSNGELIMRGVLPDVERDRILRATVPPSFVAKAMELAKKTKEAKGDKFKVSVVLDEIPVGFDLRFAGFHEKNVYFDEAAKTLYAENVKIDDKDYKSLILAAADPLFRTALHAVYAESAKRRVSSWWLFWFYILSTIGELCLSPVGLSMVSKLAPARFATMLMGIWLLTSFFGNFAAGQLGESWGTMTPTNYFLLLVVVLGGASALLFVLSRKIIALMHGVE